MIAVIGGGISGLSAAWYLKQKGQPCTLFEPHQHLGGVIQTSTWEGCVLEAGPDSFLAVKPEAAQLAREVGMESELISSNDDRRVTYIWKGGRMIPLPDGMMMMVPTKIGPVIRTPLLSWSTKIRMGFEYFHRAPKYPHERSVSEFIEEHYGSETVDYLAEPLLSGVYGGDPRALSVNAVLARFVDMETKYGSLTRGALEARKKSTGEAALFRTFRRGLGSLVDAVVEKLGDSMQVVRASVEAFERNGDAWRLKAGGEWFDAPKVILAAPAYAASELLRPLDEELGRLLSNIDYSSSMTIALVYKPGTATVNPSGFGFLVPKKERHTLMAGTWVQNKFPHRAPEGYSILRCFVGGSIAKEIFHEDDSSILRAVKRDVRALLGIDAEPAYQNVKRWRRSMAQYTLGHAARVSEIERRVSLLPNLAIAGNAYSGIGIPDCIRTGKVAAEQSL